MAFYGRTREPLRRGSGSCVSLAIFAMQAAILMAMLVICGVVTIGFGISVFFLLPDSPLYAHFLTPEERAQAVLRIKENHSGIEQKTFKREQ